MGKFDDAIRGLQAGVSKLADSGAAAIDAAVKLARDQGAAAAELSTQTTVSTLLLAGTGAKLAGDAFNDLSDRAAEAGSDAIQSVANGGKAVGRTAAVAVDSAKLGISVTGRHVGAVARRAARDEKVRKAVQLATSNFTNSIPNPVIRFGAAAVLGVCVTYLFDFVAGDDTIS
ncbi:hypothetical protein EUV02_14300 [Polymorphobacter arshaanensis]|uniref:Uncharacterized protein n=1 Tax=Glacieibacterium arshaanense TaxID=2511025 RepID=A0A4Y9EL57_9SPHN|nr:hypothetical protein [Polymorphobacter arshaanensis]TFU01444.1 hypothetical protein EUV02_14300 [Polymorphobacter arshaanensis]